MDDIFRGHGIEVLLPPYDINGTEEEIKISRKDAFLKIRETLSRIGVASRKEKNLYQSAHILHKRGRYAIVHFKSLFALDGKPTNIDDDDIARCSRIAKLLEEWELLKIITPLDATKLAPLNHIKIIKHSEKNEWNLVQKYAIGVKKKST